MLTADGTEEQDLERRQDWFALLADTFGLTFEGVPADALDRMWSELAAKHERFRATHPRPG